MAIPSIPERRLYSAGYGIGATWRTAVALAAAEGILIKTDGGLPGRVQNYAPAEDADQAFVYEGDLGDIQAVNFTPAFDLRYEGQAAFIALAQLMGTAGAPTQKGSTAAYLHTLQFADSGSGQFGTFVVERPSQIYEVASAKPLTFSLSVSDGFAQGAINFSGNTCINTSSTNTATQMDALTYADRGTRIRFKQCEVKINAQSGGAVSSETALVISDLTVEIARTGDAVHNANFDNILEPLSPGFPTVKVTLTAPRSDAVNQAWFAAAIAETEQKMAISFVGDTIEDAYAYGFNVMLPRLRMEVPQIPDDPIIPVTLTLHSEEASSAPTGMSYARPYITIQNTRTTNYLA